MKKLWAVVHLVFFKNLATLLSFPVNAECFRVDSLKCFGYLILLLVYNIFSSPPSQWVCVVFLFQILLHESHLLKQQEVVRLAANTPVLTPIFPQCFNGNAFSVCLLSEMLGTCLWNYYVTGVSSRPSFPYRLFFTLGYIRCYWMPFKLLLKAGLLT